MRQKRLKLRQRLCRFEMLEVRQVLSGNLGAEALVAYSSQPGYLQFNKGRVHQSAGVIGMTPFQIQSAYGLYSGTLANFGNQYDATGKLIKAGQFNNGVKFNGGIIGDGTGQTIAIIDSGNSPTIVADTKAFSLQFGLPIFNLSGGPTLKVVNQNGSSNPATLPVDDFDSSVETALDVQWAHAMAPNANILLVEVNDPFGPNSGGAVDIASMLQGNLYARTVPGVSVISNSWGGGEGLGETADDFVFSTPPGHAGETFVFSAGDSGGPASYPAASPNVLAVGGTTLKLSATNKYASETVWNNVATGLGAGGGGQSQALVQDASGRIFSVFPLEPVPNFQKGLGLTGRGTPDVSWDGDPVTGFAVYDSFAFGATTPWDIIGGTSAGAPQWSALLSIANQGRKLVGKNSLSNAQAVMYSLPHADFHDITIGNNDYLGFGLGITGNAATPGYDLASGLGTPIASAVVRDLVASSGTSFVPSVGGAGGGPSSGFFLSKKVRLSAEIGGDVSAGDIAAASPLANSAADEELASGQLLTDAIGSSDDSIAPVLENDSPAVVDAASTANHRMFSQHGRHGRHANSLPMTDDALDSYFAQIDGSDLLQTS